MYYRPYHIIFVSIFLLAMLLSAACRRSSNAPDELGNQEGQPTADLPFDTALENLLAGDNEAAVESFTALRDASGDEALYGEIGLAAMQAANHNNDTELQSLLRQLEGNDLPFAKALVYDLLGTVYLQQGAYVEATASLETALNLSEAANHSLWQASLTQRTGRAYAMQNIHGLAYDYTLQAHNLYAAQNSVVNKGRSLLQLGQIYRQMGFFEDALASYLEVEEMVRDTDAPELLAASLLGQGDVQAAQGEIEQALSHYEAALMRVQGSNTLAEANALFKLGEAQAQTGDIEAARASYAAAQAIFTAQGDDRMVAAVEAAMAYLPAGEFNVNLVQNPSNEEEVVGGVIPGWQVEAGLTNWRRGQEVAAADGDFHFFVGAATEETAELCQQIDVSDYALLIDNEKQQFELTLHTQVYPPSLFSSADASQYLLEYYGEADDLLDLFASPHYQSVGSWEQVAQTVTPPIGTRAIRLCLRSIKYGGFDSDGYFDGISLIALPPK